jgi:hypothetical protein
VKCVNREQRLRITSCRLAFSAAFSDSASNNARVSEAGRRVLQARLFVDDYCTQQQLDNRHSQRQVFQELKAAHTRPHFRGDALYYRPPGAHHAIMYMEQSSSEQQQQQQPEQEQQQQHQPTQPAESAEVQPLHTTMATVQPQPQPTSPASAAARAVVQHAPAAQAQVEAPAQVEASATAAPLVQAVTAPAPCKEVPRSQIQQPLHKMSKKTSSAVSSATQHSARPPLRSISNTAPRDSNTGPTTSARSVKPVWGAHIGPKVRPVWGVQSGALDARQARVGRTPHMLPNGQVEFF